MNNTVQDFHDLLVGLQSIDLLSFEQIIPELQLMSYCTQEPKHHAEGSVLVHANMALQQVLPLLEQVENVEDKLILYIATMLHDIGKKSTWAIHPKKGTITAYGHDKAGVPIANEFLKKYFPEFEYPMREKILRLIEYHMQPRILAKDGGLKPNKLKTMSLAVNTKLLYLLSQADTTGRTAVDNSTGLTLLEMFKTECEKLGIFGKYYTIPNSGWMSNHGYSNARWNILMNNAEENNQEEIGPLHTAEKLIMNAVPRFQLLMLIGAPGSGKTTFRDKLIKQYPNAIVISLDERRKEVCGDVHDQSKNEEVLNWAVSELSKAMKTKKSVIFDATNPLRKRRKMLWQIARRAGAACGAVYFDLSLETLLERNANREKRVPNWVVEKIYKMQENVLPYECDQITVVDR